MFFRYLVWLVMHKLLINRSGVVVRPENRKHAEIAEAMLLEGAEPGEINLATLKLWKDEVSKMPRYAAQYEPVLYSPQVRKPKVKYKY